MTHHPLHETPFAASRRRRGFTLVEMLVVIGVIAILLGLLLTGLRAALGAGGKTRELSALRQVFYGWSMYSSTSDEQILPGYIDVNTQDLWNVSYRDQKGDELDPQFTQAWPWRLAPYVDYSWEVLCGYRDDYDKELSAVPVGEVQTQPFFGYNALYTGGWWTSELPTGPADLRNDRWAIRTAGSFARPDSAVIFSGSTRRGVGTFKANEDDQLAGSHWVSPPIQAETPIWQQAFGGPSSIEVLAPNQSVPLNRYGAAVAILHADGAVTSANIFELQDMRRWVSGATTKEWTHTP